VAGPIVDAMTTKIRPRALVRASGGPRYAVALAVDALGTGMLRPFLLLYGITVLRLSPPVTGVAMTAGVVAGLVCMPAVGRWLDRGARSSVVAASMLVRVLGVALLLCAPADHAWPFATAALFLGIGNQAWPAAHAAVVATIARGRERDAALAGGRALRNAGLGVGALLATACLAGGTTALQALAAVTGAHPRPDFKRRILQAFTDGNKHRPHSTFGNLNADVLEHFDPSFVREDFVEIMLNNSWPE